MKDKLGIFIISIICLIAFFFIALIASLVFSIKDASSPIKLAGSGNIAILEVNGIIMDSGKITEKIADLKKESSVSGVIIRVNSPGGAVAPSQEIYQEIIKLKKVMPVYASLGTTAASGGYYIAAACSKIYSNPGSLTGSIGVIMNFFNLEKLYEFLKLKRKTIKSGRFKDIGIETRKMTAEERAILQAVSTDIYEQFISDIQATRKLPKKVLKIVSDARIMTGLQAKKYGLVDKLGTLNDAIEDLAKEANIDGEPNVVYPLREKERFFDYFFRNATSNILGLVSHQLKRVSFNLLPKNLPEVRYEDY